MSTLNPFPAYIHELLEKELKESRVVVWYDPNREFATFVEGLPSDGEEAGLKQVNIGTLKTRLAVFVGSYFALRMGLEPLVAVNRPQPILIYLPGQNRDLQGSVLMELEKAGTTWEPQMKRLARNVMRPKFSDGVIDEMLAPVNLTFSDIIGLLEQSGGEKSSLLNLVFDTQDNVATIARWMADQETDKAVQSKGASAELQKLVESRAGFKDLKETDLSGGRQKFIRYILLSEFREDLRCEPPATTKMIPLPATRDQREFCRKVLDRLRIHYVPTFQSLADMVELEFGLADAGIAAKNLGRIDTFRFEEKAVLAHCGAVLASGDFSAAAEMVAIHSGCFWARLDFSRRQAQWEVCALLGELGSATVKVATELDQLSTTMTSQDMVRRYVAPDGWHQMDSLYRRLEARVARMEEEPETEQALNILRDKVELVLRTLAERFWLALERDKWVVSDALQQTKIWVKKVAPVSGRIAIFHVDALRFEMGMELARQLSEAKDLLVEPAIAVLPSITPLGMAALLPGAAESYSVVESGGRLGARVDSQFLPDAKGRMDFLKARVPEANDITLERLLQEPLSKVQQKLDTARIVVVRSQEIDSLGEKNELLARQIMDSVIGNLARAVRRLSGLGYESFLITADHGHQFSARKGDDMKLEAPVGGTVELHRRCWIGKGGNQPAGTVTVRAPELGYDSNLEFIFPKGLGVFMAGGGLAYHHGGFSLQELVIPVVSFRITKQVAQSTGGHVRITEFPEAITNRTFGVKLDAEPDLLSTEPLQLRVLLISNGEEVGRAGMVLEAEFNRETGIVTMLVGSTASVAMVLHRDDISTLKVVLQDSQNGSVLHESKVIPIQLKS